jgi:Leucine-rich repeat (LRR) protein
MAESLAIPAKKSAGKKKSELNGAPIRARYFTPAEAYIPPLGGSRVSHYPIPVNRNVSPKAMLTAANVLNSTGNEANVNKTELDGFLLLEAAGLGFPEEVEQINLSDRHLKTVIEEDLTYFNELLYMDISENQLPFLSFGALPKLRELRMACNFISVIEDDIYGFNHLMFLDLSYNQLTVDSILALSALPKLKELDLSGNNLKTLPPELSTFQSLDKLLLQYNKLDNNDLFITLTTIPNLRSLDVSHNYFSKFPSEISSHDLFRFLDTLDISFNYFSREENIEPLIYLPRLLTVMLYGNPLLGPTGEDPMFVYIEDTVEKAHHVREQQKSSIADIEVIFRSSRK